MFINDMNYIVHGEIDNINDIKYHSSRSIPNIENQDRNIFLSKSNKKIYKKYNQYFEDGVKFNFFLHVFTNKKCYDDYIGKARDNLSSTIENDFPIKDGECNIHFMENWSGRNLMCLTPWMLTHRVSHTFINLYGPELGYYSVVKSLQNIFKCYNLNSLGSDTEIENIKKYINSTFLDPEKKESTGTSHTGLGFYPDMIFEVNSFLMKGKAAREKLTIIDADVLGEFLSAHHFGKGKFTFQDQTNINEDFLSVSKDEYMSAILEAENFITDYIDNLLLECRGKNLIF